MLYHYRYQRTCDVIPPSAPSQEVGSIVVAIILHTARLFITPTPGVPFKIAVPLMPPMFRTAVIECALR